MQLLGRVSHYNINIFYYPVKKAAGGNLPLDAVSKTLKTFMLGNSGYSKAKYDECFQN